jgi:hypothetical protein
MNKMHYDNITVPQNVRYTIIPARASKPLSDEDRSQELYELDSIFKVPSYDDQKKWLLENTMLFAGEAGDEFNAAEASDDLA